MAGNILKFLLFMLALSCWQAVCQQHTEQYCGRKRIREEEVFVIQQEKILDAARIEPLTSSSRRQSSIYKPLNYEGLLALCYGQHSSNLLMDGNSLRML